MQAYSKESAGLPYLPWFISVYPAATRPTRSNRTSAFEAGTCCTNDVNDLVSDTVNVRRFDLTFQLGPDTRY
jgi:hypothetical protein